MPQITVTAEQARLIANAQDGVEVCDSAGRVLGHVGPPVPPEEIEIAKARMNWPGPWYTTEQVLAHLDSLDEK
ncbi:MAG TPA: hypothetical protein VFI31_27225 [Pirellulales bacterium]|nr:hypothetical protein [Pirellulales bacterium]